jgi:protein TonB
MAGDGADPDGLRQYRLALAREARRFKRYPERALLAGIGGTAEVRVEHAAGAVPVAWLARSSGDEALDAAALSMMREAAPRTLVPEPLRGRSFAVSLPVIFDASAE